MDLIKLILSNDNVFWSAVILICVIAYVIRATIATISRAKARVIRAQKGMPESADDRGADEEVAAVLQKTEGGIFKQIDQNREIIEIIEREVPEIFARSPRLLVLLRSQDHFLSELADCDDAFDEDECHVERDEDSASPMPRPAPAIIA